MVLAASLLLLSSFVFDADKKKDKVKSVFIFGFSASFTDTIVYLTAIQQLDSIELKKSMLPNREDYSYQLKNYLEYDLGEKNRTCAIYFSEKQKDIEKQRNALLNRYRNGTQIRELALTDFKFEKVQPAE